MDFTYATPNPFRRAAGIGIVLVVHLLAATALIAHLSHKKSFAIVAPIETRLIEEITRQPPPDKTPPPKPAPAPRPSFMPPPEVPVSQPQSSDAIRQITATAPADLSFKPPAPLATTPAPAAPAAAGPPIPGFADLNACKPEYPRASLLAEEQGSVKLQFTVGADGQLVRSTILKSSGYPDLDKATVRALGRCRFRAAERDGAKIESTFIADWVWKLD